MVFKSTLIAVVGVLLIAQGAAARTAAGLVGAWERISMTNARGEAAKPEPAFLIFSDNGYFAQSVTPAGRPKVAKPLKELTRDELVARLEGVSARFGAYTVQGDRLTRRNIAHLEPAKEGAQETQIFRLQRDVLILSTPGEGGEVRFERMKPGG